ncbi:MAG: 2-hydroxyacyl-CoA dehydratase family protein [Deltaproteobacteria bacterium]|jgi:benzoyl-CoA reductase/2-hydroxyglutaryl-CoA dehydratase subunit BcrC/BadD/HgdB|nr:2-hydroxyacyl-CoA dehydratase family protein [Deltaproteobacteria bacterium]
MSALVAEKINDDPLEITTQKEYLEYSKTVHHYSKAIQKLIDLINNYVPDAEKAYKAGQPAIWTGGYRWEPTLLYALGVIPVSYTEMGRYSFRDDMLVAEDIYQFPVETCSMVKCSVGQWHKRLNTGTIDRILGSSCMCEPFNLAWEVMRQKGYDVYANEAIYRAPNVDGPRLESLVQFMGEQLLDVAEWVTGKREIDEERLKEEVKRKNRLLVKFRRVLDLRITHPFYMKTLPIILTLSVGVNNYFGKPLEFEAALDELIVELENEPIQEEDLKRAITLVWAGGTGQEFGVYEAIDLAGGALLGFRDVPFKLADESLPALESLVRYHYANSRAGAGVYTRNVIESEVEKLKAKGVILYGYIGCSFASIDREMWRRYFHEKGVPCLNLEGSFQTGAPSGQVLTRVRAFVEMLDSNRQKLG